jgi:hypothetical protein
LYKAISVSNVNYILFNSTLFNVDFRNIHIASMSLKIFMSYYYNGILRYRDLGIGDLKSKKKRFGKGMGAIKGFKLLLCGRFSRKQRASRVCLVKGSIPLSTKMAIIDYGFSTSVLKNSLVSIKI